MPKPQILSKITFVLNGDVCTVDDIDPTATLLQYLRINMLLTGSKEGCGEGDCGACTVVVGEVKGDGMRYVAINACIQFVAMLHGKAVWTVEGVKGAVADLHPVQEAFIKTHATQCGFCTPGFVMSLFAAYLNGEAPDGESANDLFAGNLCRCTGYSSIVNAAEKMKGQKPSSEDIARCGRDFELLKPMQDGKTVALESSEKIFYSPSSVDDLASLYEQNPDATLVAGATDVGLWVTKLHRTLPIVIHLGRVEDLRHISEDEENIVIGAGVSHSDALPVLAAHIPDFGELMRRLGATQVRNTGTVVGNIANGSPIGDTPPALMVLGARLNLRKGDSRRQIAIDDFFISYGKQDRKPGEFVESVEVPLPRDPQAVRFYKISKRFDQDISALCGCFNLHIEDGIVKSARIAYGGMAATPLHARAVEKALEGQPWTEDTINRAVTAFDTDFTPLTDMRASADYRMRVARNLLRKYFMESQNPLSQTRMVGREAVLA
jgi:xanthine dehydrogenase small subunit